jgi:hypothetical protein
MYDLLLGKQKEVGKRSNEDFE